jgi:hypothetical protein
LAYRLRCIERLWGTRKFAVRCVLPPSLVEPSGPGSS